MQATQVLSEEHKVIVRVLEALELATRQLENGSKIRPQFFLHAADFIRGFADGCHHQKEEGVLFKFMEKAGMPAENSPVGVMLTEHEQGRAFTRGMRSAAEEMQAGDDAAASKVIANAHGYVALLRQHIQKEDSILFPMADRLIPPDQHQAVWEGFEHVEHHETGEGIHEKYLALAESLEKESRDGIPVPD
jgi:hemerythrin-like domain-containing protein